MLLALSVLGSLIVSAVVVTLRVARLVVVPVTTRPEDVRILRVNRRAGTITLSSHPDAVVPGRYALYFAGDRGYAKIGGILALGSGSVTRALLVEERGRLRAGLSARISGWYFEVPDEVAPAYADVTVETALGAAPAWLVPGSPDSGRWVIQVHGRGADRRETIRSVPVFRDAGYTCLLISYRNDSVAPDSADGRYSLGDREWEDLEAAIRFAIDRGATDIILMGWSMGGALVLQAITRSPLAGAVRGIILDSPVVDWVRVLDHQAQALKVPGLVRATVYRMLGGRWGRWFTGLDDVIDLGRLDFVSRAAELTMPILLMHSDSDTFVPVAGSRVLAQLRPDIVTFVPFSGAGHTRLWNYDQPRWNDAITGWLAQHRLARPSSP